jgi:HSP20 family protein
MFTRMSDIDRMFGVMNLLRGKMDRIFGDFDRTFSDGTGLELRSGSPRISLYEDGDNFEVRAEVPGVDKKDLTVNIQGNYLEISGSRTVDVPEGYKVHRAERGSTRFSRSFTLPAEVDEDKVSASLKSGILYLTLPKSETAKPRQIAIG